MNDNKNQDPKNDISPATEQRLRIHVGLATSDVDQSIEFYRALFDTEPSKVKKDYAKFEVQSPAINLSLIKSADAALPQPSAQHFGVQLKDPHSVTAARQRLTAAGLTLRTEESVTCCYAKQDKVWAQDHDGHAWEFFAVIEDSEALERRPTADNKTGSATPQAGTADDACCAPTCCK